jgi:hypothetical protein
MAILDLQAMQVPNKTRGRGGHSGASKNCGNIGGGHISGLSLLIC